MILKFLDDLYPPARVSDVSPVSVAEIFKNRVNFKKECGLHLWPRELGDHEGVGQDLARGVYLRPRKTNARYAS